MDINIFDMDIVGYKNLKKSIASQDYLLYKNEKNYVILSVADGHSLDRFKYSEIGSKIACEVVIDVLCKYLDMENFDLLIENFKLKKIQLEIKNEWKSRVYDDFYKKNYKAYKLDYINYGTTLTFVVLFEKYIIFFNLGDGYIFVEKDGEYVNSFKNNNYKVVNSLAQKNCEMYMQYKIEEVNFKNLKLIISTDGFINSFENYFDLKLEFEKIFSIIQKDVFSNLNFKKEYKKYLFDLSKNGFKDDMSIIFLYN